MHGCLICFSVVPVPSWSPLVLGLFYTISCVTCSAITLIWLLPFMQCDRFSLLLGWVRQWIHSSHLLCVFFKVLLCSGLSILYPDLPFLQWIHSLKCSLLFLLPSLSDSNLIEACHGLLIWRQKLDRITVFQSLVHPKILQANLGSSKLFFAFLPA